MGKWGKADFKALKDLEKKLDKLEKADLDQFCREAANEIAGRLLRKVKKRTPAPTGTLLHGWSVLPIEKQGDNYVITIVNNTYYASYVEFGHRKVVRIRTGTDENGNATYGKKYVGYQKPQYILTISVQELENQLPGLLEKKLFNMLKGVFSGA